MGIEDRLIQRIDSRRREDALDRSDTYIESMYPKALSLLGREEYAIHPREFLSVYSKEEIDIDNHRVAEKEKIFSLGRTPEGDAQKRAATVFEAIMLEHSELSNWLGDNAMVIKTAPYDDYFHGSDMLAEWRREDGSFEALGLAVDVTFSSAAVEKKLQIIKSKIGRGEMGGIKYYRSADGLPEHGRRHVPHAVVGMSKLGVSQLARLWKENDKKALALHPVQRIVTDEIYAQLLAMRAYAHVRGRKDFVDAYDHSLSIIRPIRASKSNIPLGSFESDKVYRNIVEKSSEVFAV